jgi:hypothetical protein
VVPSAATDWREVDVSAYVGWQDDHGANVISCQAWTFSGYATYPSELGPTLVGTAGRLLPGAYAYARANGIPIQSYVNVGVDLAVCATRPNWLVPGSQGVEILGDVFPHGFLAPESPWTELLCQRLVEFLERYPVDWVLCDWFCYGTLLNDRPLPVTPLVQSAFPEIVGRPLPTFPETPTPDEVLRYKREILAVQFRRIRDTAKQTSPGTKLFFNVPYFGPAEPLWVDHPMLRESDGLFAESSNAEIVDWLLSVRQPDQRVFTTVYGRPDDHVDDRIIRWSDPSSALTWASRGCDLVAWGFPVPPRAEAHPTEEDAIRVVVEAYELLGNRALEGMQ